MSGLPTSELGKPVVNRAAARPARVGIVKFSAGQFLIALILLPIVSPFVGDFPSGDLVEALLVTLVMVSGVLAVGARRRSLIISAVLVIPAFFGKWINHFQPNLLPKEFYLVPAAIFLAFMAGSLLRFVLQAPKVNSDVLCGVVSIYLLLGWLWTFIYLVLAQWVPHAFTFTTGNPATQSMDPPTSFYFSFITLTTVGYGDIVPASRVARMLASSEAITGTLFLAVILARMVALYSAPPPSNENAENQEGTK